jgi:rhodanese-related sulfurtransferase
MPEFEQKLKKEKLNMIDVREDDEFEEGHVPGAVHIKLGELESRCEELDKEKEYQMICYSGSRSAMASRFLGQKGYKVTNVMGGMSSYGGELSYGR